MGGFFQQLAKTLADRWMSLLVLPVAFFLGAVWLSVSLGHSDAWNVALSTRQVEKGAARAADLPSGAQALLVVAVLAAAAGTGFFVRRWPQSPGASGGAVAPPLRPPRGGGSLRRRARWHRLVEERRALEAASPVTRTREQQDRIDTVGPAHHPAGHGRTGQADLDGRPDPRRGVDRVPPLRTRPDVRLVPPLAGPPRPRTTTELTAAHSAFAAAVATGTWAVPYLLLTVVWWPAVLVPGGIGLTGWVRARAAVADFTTLTEACLDLHGRTLAAALGVGDLTEGRSAHDRRG